MRNNPYAYFLHKSNMDKIFEDWPKIHQMPFFWTELNEFQLVLFFFGIFWDFLGFFLLLKSELLFTSTKLFDIKSLSHSLNSLYNVTENLFQNFNILANWIKIEEVLWSFIPWLARDLSILNKWHGCFQSPDLLI